MQEASARFRSLLRSARDLDFVNETNAKFSFVEEPGRAKQTQQDAYEFLEAILEAVKEDVSRSSRRISVMDQTKIALALDQLLQLVKPSKDPISVEETMRKLQQLSNLRWRVDVLGAFSVRDSELDELDPLPVSFTGQMLTCTWNAKQGVYTNFEFEPFNVWVLPLVGLNHRVDLRDILRLVPISVRQFTYCAFSAFYGSRSSLSMCSFQALLQGNCARGYFARSAEDLPLAVTIDPYNLPSALR